MEMLLLPPDFWQIDLVAKKATHITGSDKKEMHMAVFGGVPTDNPETAKTIKELEFGEERVLQISQGEERDEEECHRQNNRRVCVAVR